MTAPVGRVDVDRRSSGRVVVTVTGEIDLTNAAELDRGLDEAAASGSLDVVVDLSRVDYMDSQGLRVLQRLVKRHQEGALQVQLVSARGSVTGELLALTRLGDVVPVVEPPAPPDG
jgi:anti-anti-sigma factor